MQGVFDTLNGFWGSMGLQKNTGKTLGMLCLTCCTVGTQSEAPYEWRITGEGLPYRSHQWLWFQRPEYGADLATGLLAVHHQSQHGVGIYMGVGTQW